jgi:serine/threonine protein kinase
VADDALRERCVAAVAGLYEIEAEIGRGGMAVVYRAKDLRLRRKVALKVLPPELAYRDEVKSRFLREAEMAARLSHPHIVPIYSVDDTGGVVYFAMGLVEGESLAARLARETRPEIGTVRRILREVADALHYAHRQGVVHRDIKPDNILIEQSTGRAIVTDFGIARAAEGDQRLTVTGIAVGTPAYMSPEQAMGEREVDGRADIYALGIVGYQMLAGELPFQATNTPAMLMKHLSERPRPLAQMRAGLPVNLVQAIERSLAKGREERWADAEAFRVALADDAPEAPAPRTSAARRSHPPTVGTVKGHLEEEDPISLLKHSTPLPAPPFPPLPRDWMFDANKRESGKEILRRWREEQRRWREEVRGQPRAVHEGFRRASMELQVIELEKRSPAERIRTVRRQMAGTGVTLAMLAGINMFLTPGFPWVLFPALGMGFGLVMRISRLWADGIPIRGVFLKQSYSGIPGSEQPLRRLEAKLPAPAANSAAEAILEGVPRDVLEGRHGRSVREAFAARAQIRSVLARLPESEKSLLPAIEPTVESLVERVRTLAGALHALDADASPEALVRLQERVADAERLPSDAPERIRRIELLERQLKTLTELAERRGALAQQMESSLLVLDSMKLDLMKLRNSGLESRMADQGQLTEEMRALARDVQRVSEAVDETKRQM